MASSPGNLPAHLVFVRLESVLCARQLKCTAELAGRPQTGKRPGERKVVATSKSRGPIVRYPTSTPTADTEGDIEALSLWARQSVGLVTKLQSAADIVHEIDAEALATLRQLGTIATGT